MKTRATLIATSLLLLTVAGYASAAPAKPAKPVCNLVTDPKGDAGVSGKAGADGDDIVSADIASDGKSITGVVRTAALAAVDPQAPLGRSYFVNFSAPGSADVLFLSARTYPTGTTFVFGYSGVDPTSGVNTSYTLGQATGAVDTAKGEVRITAPISGFVTGAKAKLAPGAKLSGIGAQVYRIFGQGVVPSQTAPTGQRIPIGGLNLLFDDAVGGPYLMGTPSCVAVGK
ncbi:MAG: hypothetical protein JWP11_1599 [Frankiales bacterium]|jgi:hypothetical protein|nr:hypothetical protein [Frankiales bacterium]